MNTDGWHADPKGDAQMTSALEEVFKLCKGCILDFGEWEGKK